MNDVRVVGGDGRTYSIFVTRVTRGGVPLFSGPPPSPGWTAGLLERITSGGTAWQVLVVWLDGQRNEHRSARFKDRQAAAQEAERLRAALLAAGAATLPGEA